MRVLIIGASGFIGSYLRHQLTQTNSFKVTSTYNASPPEDIDNSWYSLEITDQHRLQRIFLEIRPDVVVLLAAIADVKTAEIEQARATEVNVDGARHVARLCTRHNARLIFLSSEYVFKGDRGNYQENDEPDPNTHYGRTKWQAELVVANEASQWSIVRTSLVYGWPITGRRNLAALIIDRLKRGGIYEGDANAYRTPIYVEHLTGSIVQLIKNYHPGTFHIAGTNFMNMYQFGYAVAEVFGLDINLVSPVRVSPDMLSETDPPKELDSEFQPNTLGLDCTQTMSMLGFKNFSIITGLEEMSVSH